MTQFKNIGITTINTIKEDNHDEIFKEELEFIKKNGLKFNQELSWDILDMVQDRPELDKKKVFKSLLTLPGYLDKTSYRFLRKGIDAEITGYKMNVQTRTGVAAGEERGFGGIGMGRMSQNGNSVLFQTSELMSKMHNGKIPNTILHRNEMGLLDIPPGFLEGIKEEPNVKENDEFFLLEKKTDLEYEQKDNAIDTGKSEDKLYKVPEEKRNIGINISELDLIIPEYFVPVSETLMNDAEYDKKWAHVIDVNSTSENFDDLESRMCKKWPFELDLFQKEAISQLEKGNSVFVAAHTSAGKTLIAEYAIALSNKHMTRTIYTSPIKALSNQKYGDFKKEFNDIEVGLITGDTQINPDASCLIMTTEILRSMLYKGADLLMDVEFVIFDEVHYVNDIDRGVVWEEVIIMLPDHVKYVLLSATIPNTYEFANWIGRTKKKDIYVISTQKRPIPLEYFICSKNEFFKVIDSKNEFSQTEFKKHKYLLEKSQKTKSVASADTANRHKQHSENKHLSHSKFHTSHRQFFDKDEPNKTTWISLVQNFKKMNLLPAIIFVFSRAKCELYSNTLKSIVFCSAKERSKIINFIDKAVCRLKKEDRILPQIQRIKEMLSRGIAVHHSGLLPIIKECVEKLFSMSLIKVLFATETFAIGLNLPTRTVVFSSLKKHDGREFRLLLPNEFIQMSGRAGRRGLDTTGTVIIMSYNKPISPIDFKMVSMGKLTKLLSRFRLTYNMILNLLRIEMFTVEEMIRYSFSENYTQVLIPENKRKIEELTVFLSNFKISECEFCDLNDFEKTFNLIAEFQNLYVDILAEIEKNYVLINFLLKPGTLIFYKDHENILKIGILIKIKEVVKKALIFTFDHGLKYQKDSLNYNLPFIPVSEYLKLLKGIQFAGSIDTIIIPINQIVFISKYILTNVLSLNIKNEKKTSKILKAFLLPILKSQKNIEELNFHFVHLSMFEIINKKKQVLDKLKKDCTFTCPNFKLHYKEYYLKDTKTKEVSVLKSLTSDENLSLLPDYEQRLEVLKYLNFIDENHNVVLKGRVACEINFGWELVITELILDNFLGKFTSEEIVALMSCFVYDGKVNEQEPKPLTLRLEEGKQKVIEIVKKLLDIYSKFQVSLTQEEDQFLNRMRFSLINVVYEWSKGLSLFEIMKLTSESEGTIVRLITRLDEVCREVKNASLIIGDALLYSKISEAQEKIKRDIVFCSSLYL